MGRFKCAISNFFPVVLKASPISLFYTNETFIFIMSFHDISKKLKKPIFAVTTGIYVVQCSRLRQPNFFARLHMCTKYETGPICI